MSKVVVDLTISLDGFIAGPEGNDGAHSVEALFNWYFSGAKPNEHDPRLTPAGKNTQMVDAMFEDTGAMLTGRRTYDVSTARKEALPIQGVPIIVLTHHVPREAPESAAEELIFVHDIHLAVKAAKQAAGAKNVRVAGGHAPQQCLHEGLADELHVRIAPVLLGAGVRLFERLGAHAITLELIETVPTPEVVHLRYRVLPRSS